jgi:hypothetical protein
MYSETGNLVVYSMEDSCEHMQSTLGNMKFNYLFVCYLEEDYLLDFLVDYQLGIFR